MTRSDICIAGAGIIGLSLALELHYRGLSVVVLDARSPMQEASSAAAGMLAADDPHNPPEISALAHLSLALYPSFLDRIHALSGVKIPFQTTRTLQAITDEPSPQLTPDVLAAVLAPDHTTGSLPSSPGFHLLHEQSVDPRQLAPALIAAVAATSIQSRYNSPVVATKAVAGGVQISSPQGLIEAAHFMDCSGAWSNAQDLTASLRTRPIKGQMLALELPKGVRLNSVVRTKEFYIVPRTSGPSAGRAIVGATIEGVGYDKVVHLADIETLHRRAIALIPSLDQARIVESWAGLRPATSDLLPLIGPHPTRPNHWLATGHYRNGILLAPATAMVTADRLLDRPTAVSMDLFSPARFIGRTPASSATSHILSDIRATP